VFPVPSVRPSSLNGSPVRDEPGFLGFLRSHPILCLAILTPGIPEYLSTSSSLLSIVVNPAWFVIQLAINVAQYTAGALLIREAILRWHKGWGSLFLLGLAYGITEEGLGDNTLFNSNHGADGFLGWFGRFDGVNWVWSTGVLSFHVIYSIGLPILLLALALPQTRGVSLVTGRGIAVCFTTLVASTSLEAVIVYRAFHFWMGFALLAGAMIVIMVLVVAAYFLPRDAWRPATEQPHLSALGAGVWGFAVFPVLFTLEYFVPATGIPPVFIIAAEVVFLMIVLETWRRTVGRIRNEYVLVNLAYGFVLWQAVFGMLLTLPILYTIPLVALAVWFFTRLRRAYAPRPSPIPPDGARGIPASF